MSLPFHPENLPILTDAEKALDPINTHFWDRRYCSPTTLKLRSEVMKCLNTCLDGFIAKEDTTLPVDVVIVANSIVDKYEQSNIEWTSLKLCAQLAKCNSVFKQLATDTLRINIVP